MKQLSPKSYLALGDSYTIGECVEPNQRWSAHLIDLLTPNISITEHDIVAQTGWTTFELEAAIPTHNLKNKYDLVSLLIGVNNQYRGLSQADFRKDFQHLLTIAAGLCSNSFEQVMVLSIPDWSITPFASNRDTQQIAIEIDSFNQIIMEECRSQNVSFIDITGISRSFANDAEMIAEDQLHFSGKMYRLWALAALEKASEILSKS